MLLASFLSLALAVPQGAVPPTGETALSSFIPAQPAEIRVLSGRAVLAEGGGPRVLFVSKDAIPVAARAHLEIPAGGRARIAWPGRASLLVVGPASLEWQPPPELRDEDLEWRVLFAERAFAEVRRGAVRLFSAYNWEVALESCALEFSSRPDESIDIRLQAGGSRQAFWMGSAHHARPPVRLYCGRTVHLGPIEGLPVPLDRTRRAPPWKSISWPWPVLRKRLVPVEEPVAELPVKTALSSEPTPVRWTLSNTEPETVPESPARITPHLGPLEAPLPALTAEEQRALEEAALPEPEIREPIHLQLPAQPNRAPRVEEVYRPEPETLHDPAHWHSLRASELRTLPDFVFQAHDELDILELLGERYRLRLSPQAATGAWVFGREQDAHLSPGAVILVSSEGEFLSHYGPVELQSRAPGRPGR